MTNKIASFLWPIVFSFLVTLPVILPYIHKGYFPTHDGEWAIVRASEMFRELRDGQFPARLSSVLNFEYGYPLFNFTYPAPYYFTTVLHVLRFGFVDSIKILFAASTIFSAFFMFLASRTIWRNTFSAIISVLLYMYLPYRFVDLFVRGSVGESISFALFPLLFFLFFRMDRKDSHRKLYALCSAIAYGILIMSHNIMAIYFSIMLIGFIIIKSVLTKKVDVRALLATAFGLLLSAFFWLPALFEKQFILLSKIPIADRSLYFVKIPQLFLFQWGYEPPTQVGGFTYQIGLPHVVGFLLTFFVAFYLFKKNKKIEKPLFLVLCILSFFVLCFSFLLFSQSQLIWKYTPLLSEINYPWTLLLPIGFLLSLLVGFLGTRGKTLKIVALILAASAIGLYIQYAHPKSYIDRGDGFYLTNEATTTSSDELMPLWVLKKPSQSPSRLVEIDESLGMLTDSRVNSKAIQFTLHMEKDGLIVVNKIFYPGWQATVDGKASAISYTNDKGVMELYVAKGKHTVGLTFSETPLRLAADYLSLFSFGALVILLTLPKKNWLHL